MSILFSSTASHIISIPHFDLTKVRVLSVFITNFSFFNSTEGRRRRRRRRKKEKKKKKEEEENAMGAQNSSMLKRGVTGNKSDVDGDDDDSLADLPMELLLLVVRHLSVTDFASLCSTNKRLRRQLWNDSRLWRGYCERDLGLPLNSNSPSSSSHSSLHRAEADRTYLIRWLYETGMKHDPELSAQLRTYTQYESQFVGCGGVPSKAYEESLRFRSK